MLTLVDLDPEVNVILNESKRETQGYRNVIYIYLSHTLN